MASIARLTPLLPLLVLFCGLRPTAPQPDPAPWSGIVGFLRMVARIQQTPELAANDLSYDGDTSGPLRKIVYGVEEQTSGGEGDGSIIVFDSSRDENLTTGAAAPGPSELTPRNEKAKRSADGEENGRQAGTVGTRPFLIGRKLWYVPLWFSIYLILYITALTIKSVARHRIKYPTLLSEDDVLTKRRNGLSRTDSYTRRVTNAIANGEKRYQPFWSM